MTLGAVNTNGFSMDYFCFGNGPEALVILPGLAVQSVMSAAAAVEAAYRTLADGYTIYLFDRRKELPAAYNVDDMARDTAAALAALGLHGVNLFGASQGGMIAMRMAVDHPELVKRLVLGSTSACVDAARYQTIERWVQLARDGRSAELYLAFGEALYPRDVFEPSRALLLDAAKTVTRADLERFVILAEGLKGFDMTAELPRIACPTLVIGSEDDRVLGPEASRRIAEGIGPNAGLHMYDGYGHAAYDTAPDYKERVRRFLEKQ